jgi:type II secretory pathway pseudopilin PulG
MVKKAVVAGLRDRLHPDKLQPMASSFRRRANQSGYVLMVIMFMVVLLIVGLLATAPAIKTQIQRDREAEMIHRGAQYSRAIKKYFKKFGRYPGTLSQLENTNNIRFLRKQYKDPMSADGKWKLLHVGDVKTGNTSNVGTPVSAMGTQGGAGGNLGQPAGQSAFGGSPGTLGGAGSAFGGGAGGLGGTGGTIGGLGAMGGSSSSAAGAGTQGGAVGSQSSTTGSSSMTSSTNAIGGGVIIGVSSLSEREGLHEFNEKTHYNEWYFFYDPTTDRGGLITGPFTGKTFTAAGGIGTPASALGKQPSSGFGQPSSFGQSGGMGQQTPQPPQQPQNPR